MPAINGLFNEICKVSTMNATAALSKFLNTPVAVDIKPVEIKPIDDIDFFMNDDDSVVSVYIEINGAVKGASFLLWSQKAAHAMCEVLYHRQMADTKGFREEEISALTEVANIVIGNFLSSFAQSLQIDRLLHRSPTFECAEFKAIQEKWLPQAVEKLTELVVDISFGIQHVHIKGYVVIIFEEKSIQLALNNISVDSSI